MATKDGLGSTMYEGAAAYGTFQAYLGAIIISFFGGIFVLIGLHLMMKTNYYDKQTMASVTNVPKCGKKESTNTVKQKNGHSETTTSISWDCPLVVDYSVDNESYSEVPITVNRHTPVSQGENITVFYHKDDNSKIQQHSDSAAVLGAILFFVALVFIGLAWLRVYIVNKYKFAAAATGASSAINMISGR